MVDYLAEAFKALDDVEDVTPCLHEEMFTVDSDGLSELADFEVENEKSEDKKRVIDPEAKNEEELKSSYVGKVIIDCNQCHSKVYKDKEDIVIDGDDVNKEEECPYCFATEGFKVVGEVAPYTETKVDVEVKDEDTMAGDVQRRAHDAKKTNDKVVEEFEGSPDASAIIDDLVDRAKLIYKEQDGSDIDEAVSEAIDDGLIYYDDIIKLADALGVIDYGELEGKFIDDLSDEMRTKLEHILAEEDDEIEESVKGRENERGKSANGDNTIRDWYIKTYPTDELGEEIDESVTFDDVFSGLKSHEDFYEMIGVYDSIVRERIFDELAKSKNVSYDKIYKLWLDGSAIGRKSRRKGKLTESDRIRWRDIDNIPYDIGQMSNKAKNALDHAMKMSDKARYHDNDEKKARRIDRKINSLKDYKFVEDLGDDVAKYQRWVDYDMKRYGKISDKTKSYLDRAGLEVVKDDHKDYEVIAKDEGLAEAPIYDLETRFDPRQSFYRKARVDTGVDDNENKLYSYDTLVAEMINGKPVVYNVQSGTTLRHVKEWLRQNGFKAETKSQVIRDYGADDIVTESLEEVEVKTDTDKIKISSETITKDDEMAIPVTDDTREEIIADGEKEDTVDDIEEFDEESFDELSESYLKKVYNNVDGYKTSNVSFNKSGLCVEGIISFKSGNKKNTQFIFESRDNGKRFVGENKQITRGKKAFTVKGSIKDGKFITESFNYRYSAINPQTGKSENLYETLKRGK